MASKKKGCIVLKKNNMLKVTYSHRNSEPEGIGKKIVKMIRTLGTDALSKYFDEVQMVKEEDPMTPEQVESYKKYMPEQLWKDDLTWPEALAWTKNAVEPIMDRYPWMVDYAGFNGAWVNRWRYVIDLDRNRFIVVRGGYEILMLQEDRYDPDLDWFDKMSYTQVGNFPLDDIPKDWLQQVKDYWGSCMIIAVPHHQNSEAEYSDEIQSHSRGGYNPGDYDWNKIKFFYGENHYKDLLSDWK